jgi:PAS domain S-box-containing protein
MRSVAPLVATQTRILLVEDEGLIAMDLKRRLHGLGFTVTSVVRTADDAVRLAIRDIPDLILMDIHLRGKKDGIQAAQEIRKTIDVPIVYLTAHSDTFTIERAKMTGPFGYITKPFETEHLRVHVEMALAKHQAEQKLRLVQAYLSNTLQKREQELSTLLDHTPDIVIRLDRELRFKYVNAMTASISGIPQDAFMGKTPAELRLPEDLIELWLQPSRRTLDTGQTSYIEFAFPSPGGETQWEERFIPEFGPDGTVESLLIIGRDITRQKRLEKVAEKSRNEIRSLAGRLMTAQEEERRRVSRELHDQTCQYLASIAIDIGALAVDPTVPDAVRQQLRALQTRAVKASEETRHIAYELHPSTLEDLGLASSLQDLCKRFSGHGTEINLKFKGGARPALMPLEVASCLYRVTQESLQNAAKHAGAKHVRVELASRKGKVLLTIADDGAGFDPAAVKAHGGLGLIGMEERARLVNGKLAIAAEPGRGTRIVLEIPSNPSDTDREAVPGHENQSSLTN